MSLQQRGGRETQKPGVIIIKAVRGLEIGAGGSVSEPRWLGDAEALWGQQLGAGSQSLGSPGVNSGVSPEGWPCRPKWPLALTSVESVSCGHTVVPSSGLRVIQTPALGDCMWCPFSVVLERGGGGQTLASWGLLRTLGCSINTQDSYQGPDEFLKTVIGWDKAQHNLSVKGCVLVCWGCCNNSPQSGWLAHRAYLTALEAGSSRSRSW